MTLNLILRRLQAILRECCRTCYEKARDADKENFLVAASFDENENDYLTEAELKKAAVAYLNK